MKKIPGYRMLTKWHISCVSCGHATTRTFGFEHDGKCKKCYYPAEEPTPTQPTSTLKTKI